MIIRFGPYKGQAVAVLPIRYIKRLLERIDIKNPDLKEALENRIVQDDERKYGQD